MLLTRPPLGLLPARLACVKLAASVRSEPGSNSPVMVFEPVYSRTGQPGLSFSGVIPAWLSPPGPSADPTFGTGDETLGMFQKLLSVFQRPSDKLTGRRLRFRFSPQPHLSIHHPVTRQPRFEIFS